jgi:cell wall-associated NlpC family hydrolase
MTSKNISRLKLITTLSLLLIVLISFAYGSLTGNREKKREIAPKILKLNKNQINAAPVVLKAPLRDSIVSFGMELLGTPYVTAGCSRAGFDCSGFIYFVFQHFDITVPRSSAQFENFGKDIPINEVKKGDILLFLSPTRNVIGHIGIVSVPKGMESDFIHATSGRDMKVVISSLKQRGYTDRFVKAIRVL